MVTFEVRPLGEPGPDGRNLEGKRAQKFPSTKLELFHVPGSSRSQGELVVAIEVRGLLLFTALGGGMDTVYGGGEVGAIRPGRQLTSTTEGMRPELQPRPVPASQCLQLASRPPRPSDGGPATPGLAAIPRMNGGEKRPWQSSASGSRPGGGTAKGKPSYWPLLCWDHGKYAVITPKTRSQRRGGEVAGTV